MEADIQGICSGHTNQRTLGEAGGPGAQAGASARMGGEGTGHSSARGPAGVGTTGTREDAERAEGAGHAADAPGTRDAEGVADRGVQARPAATAHTLALWKGCMPRAAPGRAVRSTAGEAHWVSIGLAEGKTQVSGRRTPGWTAAALALAAGAATTSACTRARIGGSAGGLAGGPVGGPTDWPAGSSDWAGLRWHQPHRSAPWTLGLSRVQGWAGCCSGTAQPPHRTLGRPG